MSPIAKLLNAAALISALIGIALAASWFWFQRKTSSKRSAAPRWIFVVIGSITAVILAASLSEKIQETRIYEVDVRVQGPHSEIAVNAHVWASVEAQRIESGPGHWTIRVPAASLPPDGSFKIYAESGSDVGSTVVTPGLSSHVTVDLGLRPGEGTIIRGIVIDDSGRPIQNADVRIIGGSHITTDSAGNFIIKFAGARGESAFLLVEKEGYIPLKRYTIAAEEPVALVLHSFRHD